MPDPGAVAATRVALLELRDERRLVQEGYELLDEKRVLLATATLRELAAYTAAQRRLESLWRDARAGLADAVEVHGFEDVTVVPPASLEDARLRTSRRRFLGLLLTDAALDAPPSRWRDRPLHDSPELRRCAAAFRAVAVELVAQAARAANLRRLVDEYRRTERRARALENVLLPEIESSLATIEGQLELADQEEALRIRLAGQRR